MTFDKTEAIVILAEKDWRGTGAREKTNQEGSEKWRSGLLRARLRNAET